ncbi:hypothetical protein ACOQFL_06765 [Actinopolyspora sp. H202]|uniref:hypothetical protein n=1 Tax=Actinopolyspora sp. H202 TaxID=1500456 RepID=UPI003EE48599
MTQPPGGPYDNTSGQSGFGPRGGQQYPQWPPHSGGSPGGWSADSGSSPYGWHSDSNHSGMPRESVYRGFGTFDEPARGGSRRGTRWRVITGLALAVLLLASAITISIYYGTASSPSGGNVAAGEESASATNWIPPPAPEAEIEGWQVAYNRRIQLAYDVPPDWNVYPSDEQYSIPEFGELTFRGLVDGPSYRCDGTPLVGGRVVSTRLSTGKTMPEAATALLNTAKKNFYTTNGVAQHVSIETGEPRETTVEGFEAVRLSGTVTLHGEGARCVPTQATMAALVIKARDDYVVLVASADSERPASSPSAPGERLVPRIIDTARPVRR